MNLPPPPWVVAHRGASGDRLENTIPACLLAVEVGAPMLEVDVQLAADGELVVFHDWDLARLGGDPAAPAARVVERLGSRELAAIPLCLAVPATGEPRRGVAPTLGELLAALPPAFPVNLELKRREADPQRFAAALLSAIAGRRNVLVSSFDWDQLEAVRALSPELPLAPLDSRPLPELLAAADRLGAWSVNAHHRLASVELSAAARDAGRRLLVYTVNVAAEARRLFALGVSGVFTDHPARLLRELAATADRAASPGEG